jgi:diacylglycerol kinase
LEAVNSAVEYVVDLASPDYHKLAEKAKDMAAGAVLLAAIGSVIIALIIFLPKIIS